jgi:hypothetical protein
LGLDLEADLVRARDVSFSLHIAGAPGSRQPGLMRSPRSTESIMPDIFTEPEVTTSHGKLGHIRDL